MKLNYSKFILRSVEILTLIAGAYATWIASASEPVVFIRIIYVLLIDGSWYSFMLLVEATPKKELVSRITYSIFLVVMTFLILLIASSSGLVATASRVAMILVVARSVFDVVGQYSQYRRDNASAILTRWKAGQERKNELSSFRADGSQTRLRNDYTNLLRSITTRIAYLSLFFSILKQARRVAIRDLGLNSTSSNGSKPALPPPYPTVPAYTDPVKLSRAEHNDQNLLGDTP